MTETAIAKLYTPEVLARAVELAKFPILPKHTIFGEVSSRSCGSRLRFACNTDEAGAVADFGLQVTACAIGQAAAAVFATDLRGRTGPDILRALDLIGTWLEGSATDPSWRGMEMLEGARAHPGRHGAILLPWKAAAQALSNAPTPR